MPLAAAQKLPTTVLSIHHHRLQVEIANTDATRTQGLMHRSHLATNSGMLFVFDQPVLACFWMKNTPLNLSIAFVDAAGVITNIEQMQAFDLQSHCPNKPIKYAIEMEQGWFDSRAVAGDQVNGLPQ